MAVVVRRRLCRRVFALIIATSLVSAGGPRIVRAQAGSAAPPDWTAPKTVLSDSMRSLQWPSLATRGETIYVAANLLPVSRDSTIGARHMILQRIPGSPIPLPAGNFAFALPQGVVDAAGVYHLVWAEFRPGTDSGRAWPPNPATLWYARWASGVWSAPEKVAEGTSLYWNGEQGHVVLDSTGALHVVVAGFFQPAGFAIAHLTRRHASWARQTLPIQPLYVSMAATKAGLVLAYVAADSAAGGSATVLMVRHSTDGSSNSWNPPVLVARADHGGLGSPILLQRPSGGEDLLWMESSSPLAQSQRLHRISISDRGALSSRDESIDTHGLPGSLRAAATPCSQIAVVEVLESRAGRSGVSLQAIRFNRFGVPTSQTMIYPQFQLTASGAVAPLADSVALVFAAVKDSTHSATVEVGRTGGCQRPPR